MAGNITSLTNNGVRDWLLQRASAVVLGAYFLFVLFYIVLHPALDYQQWHGLFQHPVMRAASVLALLSLLIHAWIGMWTVATDYVKVTSVRLVYYSIVIIALLSYFLWGIEIIWS
jgi:succinate dehydrogenase membrane anchor subunit